MDFNNGKILSSTKNLVSPRRYDPSLGYGVYYRDKDYVGFGPRLIILLVDSTVLLLLLAAASVAIALLGVMNAAPYFFIWIVVLWAYVVLLKRSSLRTAGYRLMKCRLVTLEGHRPGLGMMTLRSMLWMVGPCNYLLDIVWCGIDPDRQSLRDRFSGVCLIRDDAVAVGRAPIHLFYLFAMGWAFFLPRVVHDHDCD